MAGIAVGPEKPSGDTDRGLPGAVSFAPTEHIAAHPRHFIAKMTLRLTVAGGMAS
jgi:hypothetical protein